MSMYNYRELDNRQEFLSIVCVMEYKEGDEAEAKALGYPSVSFLYHNTFAPYMRYFIVEDDNGRVLATIVLRRDGNIEYFITNDVTSAKIPSMVKTMKALANEVTEKLDVIFTTTLETYEGAVRFNELVGFKKISTNGKFGTWSFEHEKISVPDTIEKIETNTKRIRKPKAV